MIASIVAGETAVVPYGFQIGGHWSIVARGPFALTGLVKVGMFANNAAESTGVSIYRKMYWESASTTHAAFLGEVGLRCKYHLTERLLLKAGYEAMWLEGVALAAGQIVGRALGRPVPPFPSNPRRCVVDPG